MVWTFGVPGWSGAGREGDKFALRGRDGGEEEGLSGWVRGISSESSSRAKVRLLWRLDCSEAEAQLIAWLKLGLEATLAFAAA